MPVRQLYYSTTAGSLAATANSITDTAVGAGCCKSIQSNVNSPMIMLLMGSSREFLRKTSRELLRGSTSVVAGCKVVASLQLRVVASRGAPRELLRELLERAPQELTTEELMMAAQKELSRSFQKAPPTTIPRSSPYKLPRSCT